MLCGTRKCLPAKMVTRVKHPIIASRAQMCLIPELTISVVKRLCVRNISYWTGNRPERCFAHKTKPKAKSTIKKQDKGNFLGLVCVRRDNEYRKSRHDKPTDKRSNMFAKRLM